MKRYTKRYMRNRIGNHVLVLYKEEVSTWMSIAISLKLIPRYRFADELYERRGVRYRRGVLQVKIFWWWINFGKRPKFKSFDLGVCNVFSQFLDNLWAKENQIEWYSEEERGPMIFVYNMDIPDRDAIDDLVQKSHYTIRLCNSRLNRRMVLASKSVWDLRGFFRRKRKGFSRSYNEGWKIYRGKEGKCYINMSNRKRRVFPGRN